MYFNNNKKKTVCGMPVTNKNTGMKSINELQWTLNANNEIFS